MHYKPDYTRKFRWIRGPIGRRFLRVSYELVFSFSYYDNFKEATEKAAYYAGHSSPRTTHIYDRRRDIGNAEDIARTRLYLI